MRAVLVFILLGAMRSVTSQPLAGPGGGGGGGGFGFDDSDTFDDTSPSCPPYCHSCTTDDVCDNCYAGYKLMDDGSCKQCPSGCKKCDIHGPYKCDVCTDRHVLVSPLIHRRCKPCANHCMRCHTAGPGACDDGMCDLGYLHNEASKVCEACTKRCNVCVNTTDAGCVKCQTFFKLDEGNCTLDKFIVGMIVSVITVILTFILSGVAANNRGGRSSNRMGRMHHTGSDAAGPLLGILSSHESFVAASESPRPSTEPSWRLLPSGVWRGYYTHSGARHDVCEFTLDFGTDGSATGRGVDDVGEYTFRGLYNRDGSMLAFTKTYVGRSRNVTGVVSYGNQGHSVEYRGELATGSGGALGGGFRGDWAIRHEYGNSDGTFHIWPAMEGWQESETEFDTEPQHKFEVESECVVCFDNPITTTLRPCGHQVLCKECAGQLRRPSCPICRTPISSISHNSSD